MSVPKGRRNESPFETRHQLFKLRDVVTELMFNNFGFSKEKYQRQIDRYYEAHKHDSNIDQIMERYKAKQKSFIEWFIDKERDAVLEILRRIECEFTFGNSIYISDTIASEDEFIERRKHITAAIAECYVLKQEIQYVIRTLPVNINKYSLYDDLLEKQISLLKGVRKADNKKARRNSNSRHECVKQESCDETNMINNGTT